MEEIKSREKETEGKEYAGHLISGRKCGKMKNTHKIRGRKRANHRMPNHKTWEKV